MTVGFIILSVVFVLCCAAMVGAILAQKKRSAGGMGSVAGMGNVAGSYWDKNKSNTMDGKLEKWTKIGAVLLGIMSIVLCII